MSYAALVDHHRRLSRLRHIDAILGWDEAVMMPAAAGSARADALSTLRGLIHEEATRECLGDLFAAAATEAGNLDPWQKANLREMEREWVRATAIPQRLVEAMSRAESESEQAWRRLRSANDFATFLPFFREVLRLKREAAQAWGEKLSMSPYDALIDGFEPGGKVALIEPLFARLRAFLPGLIQSAMDRQAHESLVPCDGPFPEASQRALGIDLMRRLGFDFDHGRLDKSHHPFCGGVPTDVRITTRYDANDYAKSMMSVLHETGHAKYEQHLPRDWQDQPVGTARGMSIHESQSLFLEMQICRSRGFLEFAAPIIAGALVGQCGCPPEAFGAENLFRQLTRVTPSLIRVDADEATYPCHIVLRFELEKSLFDGSLRPDDVPEAWDRGMRELLGLSTLGNDRDGCMQDVHWPAGLFGYFPSYTLGALTAAQLYEAVQAAHPTLTEEIRTGRFASLDGWLDEHVWKLGSFLETGTLLERATGKQLGTAAFERHLSRRYLQRES